MIEPTDINRIGNDHLYHILKWLPPKDLAVSAKVCVLWKQLIQDNIFWKSHTYKALPHFQIIPNIPHWVHYSMNAPGIPFRKIHVSGSRICSAWGKTITVWTPSIGQPQHYEYHQITTSHSNTISCFAMRYFGLLNVLITGSTNGEIKVYNVSNHLTAFDEAQTLNRHRKAIKTIDGFGPCLLTSEYTGSACLWKFSTYELNFHLLQENIETHKDGLSLVATVPI